MRYQGGVQFARNTMFNFAGIFNRLLGNSINLNYPVGTYSGLKNNF